MKFTDISSRQAPRTFLLPNWAKSWQKNSYLRVFKIWLLESLDFQSVSHLICFLFVALLLLLFLLQRNASKICLTTTTTIFLASLFKDRKKCSTKNGGVQSWIENRILDGENELRFFSLKDSCFKRAALIQRARKRLATTVGKNIFCANFFPVKSL